MRRVFVRREALERLKAEFWVSEQMAQEAMEVEGMERLVGHWKLFTGRRGGEKAGNLEEG